VFNMKKWIYILILLPISAFGQLDSCGQYKKVINYFESDTTFSSYFDKVKLKFKVRENIGSGGIYPFMTYDYIAGKLGLNDKKLIFAQDTAIIQPMARQLEKEEYSDTTEYVMNCLPDLRTKRNAKIYVNFYRKDKNVLSVYTGRIYRKPRHTYGMMHLFFFNNNNEIKRVFESTWIE